MKTRLLLLALPILATASSAHASLMYSGVQNIPIPFDLPAGFEGVYLKISDGTTTGAYPATWNTAPWINPFFGGVDIANSDLLRPVITGSDQILNLALGTVIDGTGNFVSGESGSSTHTGVAANQFHLGVPGLIGVAFKTTVGGPDYYGWIRMTASNTGPGAIVDWAYDSTAGTPVQAGISAVPEPAAALVGVALCCVSMLRRRRGPWGAAMNACN